MQSFFSSKNFTYYLLYLFTLLRELIVYVHFMDIQKRPKIKKIKKSSEAQKLVSNLGKHDRLSEDDIMKCSKYLVKYIYRDKEITTIVEARARKLRVMKNKTTLRLPPDGDSFVQHLPWDNYQARIWSNFTTPDGTANPFHYG